MGFTIHCGAERFFLAPDVHIQSPRHSINRAHNHSTQKKLNQGSTLHGRSFHNRKLWSGYRHRDNILFIRAINEDGNVAENGERKGNEDTDFKWNKVGQAFGRGFDRFCHNFQRELKRDTGIDIERVKAKVVNASKDVQVAVEGYKQKSTESVDRLRFQLWPRFLAWNQWELWKDFKRWESKRIGALVLYVLVVAFSFRGLYLVFKTSRVDRQTTNRLANAYMEAFIPDPSPSNVRKLKKGLWRSYMPERLKVTKYLLAPGGDYVRDRSYVGQDAWEDDPEPPESNLEKVTSEDTDFGEENKQELKKEPGLEAGLGKRQAAAKATWQERLAEWEYILAKEKWAEDIDALTSKYVISFDWQEIQKNFLKEQNEKRCNRQRYRGEWILKRWWQYRPKLPYTYFLQKVECLEVEAVVYSEDLKRVFVTMKEGFPSQYIVDIPVDPYLFELLTSCGVEVDTLHRSRFHYLLRALAVLAPGFLLLWLIERTLYTLCLTSTNVEYDILKSKYENLILPGDAEDSSVSGYKDVVLGGDVWDLLDEIMLYMKNPMKYYNKGVKLPRGILISGPPGTGKTLLARAIARESGLPFVFASGAEFAESGTKSGSEKIFDIFFTARANAPSFIFIDEIDALAGKHANDDPERSATFDQLLSQLDGEYVFFIS